MAHLTVFQRVLALLGLVAGLWLGLTGQPVLAAELTSAKLVVTTSWSQLQAQFGAEVGQYEVLPVFCQSRALEHFGPDASVAKCVGHWDNPSAKRLFPHERERWPIIVTIMVTMPGQET